MTIYLDVWELGERIERSPAAIQRQLKTRPWDLPPRLYVPGSPLLRWRRQDVEIWIHEQEQLNVR